MKFERKRKIEFFIFLSFFSILLLFFVSVIFISLNNNEILEEKTEDIYDNNRYQYLEVDKESKNQFSGLVNLPRPLEKDFKSYQRSDNGNYVLISQIGSREYKCTGTCSCENSGQKKKIRRSAAIPFSKGLFYLLTATSTLTAIKLAEKYFQMECEEKYSDSCRLMGSDRVEVDEFEQEFEDYQAGKIKYDEDEEDYEGKPEAGVDTCWYAKEENEYVEEDHVQGKDGDYFCYGRCATRTDFKNQQWKEIAEKKECEEFDLQEVVVVEVGEDVESEDRFRDSFLEKMCKEKGKVQLDKEVGFDSVCKAGEIFCRTMGTKVMEDLPELRWKKEDDNSPKKE